MDKDNFSPLFTSQISHHVELYTERLLVTGHVAGPFKRLTDLINQRERMFLAAEDASIVPVGLQATPRKLSTAVLVQRSEVHMVAVPPAPDESEQGSGPGFREFYIRKVPQPCYVLTDTFVIHGKAHLHQGAALNNLLETGDLFVPITDATVYLVTMPNNPWQRDLVIVNKERIHVMYATEEEKREA